VAALVDSSPAALDTLNELAAALNDDPNFAATMTAELSKKMDKASNGADIPDVAAFLNNLGLKEAAKRAVGTGAGQIPDMSFFSLAMGQTGYQKLPSGMIIQWGTVAMDGNGNAFATLPTAFPSSIHGGLGSEGSPSGWTANSCVVVAVDIAQSSKTVVALRGRSIVGANGPNVNVSGVAARYFVWGY